MPNIFPIILSDTTAKMLIEKRFGTSWKDKVQDIANSDFNFHGYIYEDKTVRLSVSYQCDNGFILSTGSCFEEVGNFVDDSAFEFYYKRRLFQLAEAAIEAEEIEKYNERVRQRAFEMFGEKI